MKDYLDRTSALSQVDSRRVKHVGRGILDGDPAISSEQTPTGAEEVPLTEGTLTIQSHGYSDMH